MTRIQATGEFGARDEYVVAYNNSAELVDISDWCLMNKVHISFACFTSQHDGMIEQFFLPPYGYMVIVSRDHAQTHAGSGETYSLVYDVTNASNGSIINSSESLLLQIQGVTGDMKEWTSPIPGGKQWARVRLSGEPDLYTDTWQESDWFFDTARPLPRESVIRIVLSDANSEPNDAPDPSPSDTSSNPGTPDGVSSTPQAPLSTLLPPRINELLPNPVGSDSGKEFIELYNPNQDDAVSLDGLSILVGTDTVKEYPLPPDVSIPPLGYVTVTNQEVGYTLVNTSGKVQLAQDGQPVGEPVEYTSPKEGQSWAYIDGTWQYTTQPTPASANGAVLGARQDTASKSKTSSVPCAENQFRNPATGRCKRIESPATPAPCKAGQERNPETNRCRSIAAASAAPAPCKEGQVRNPDTNRCRAVVKMSDAAYPVQATMVAGTALRWYYWVAIGGIVLLVGGYALWEWREELRRLVRRAAGWIQAHLAK